MRGYLNNLRQFALYMRNCDIEEVKLSDIYEYLKGMEDLGWEANSLSSKAGAYKQFFDFFKKQGLKVLEPSLIPVPTMEFKFPKVMTDDDFTKLVEVTSEATITDMRNKLILLFLADTGARRDEVRTIKTEQLDTVNMKAVIKTEKSKGLRPARAIFWTQRTNDVLIKYLDMRKERGLDNEALFVALHQKHYNKQMSATSFHAILVKLSKEAGLSYIANPHSFRHRFGRKLALQNANANIISDMMGHANINSTRIYTIMNDQTQQDVYEKHFRH